MKLTTLARNAACQALVELFDLGTFPGYIQIRSGVPPASAQSLATGVILCKLDLPSPAFGSAGSVEPGVAVANAITPMAGVADGEATWFRVYDGDDTPIEDGSVSMPGMGGDMTLTNTTISTGVDVSITSWTITMPES